MADLPKITFGVIVLNGEPFTRYNLRALYPFAHEIIVVEGASQHAADIATEDGHSTDHTLEALREFKRAEDADNKVQIVTAEDEGHPNGFWPGEKDEQSRAYATRATGDWLWQVDIDEFYLPENMQWVCDNLMSNPTIWTVSFRQIQFWGGLKYYADGWFLRHFFVDVNRLFRWGQGYRYVSHRPVVIHDSHDADLRSLGWVRGDRLARHGVYMYHYSLVFPHQVEAKSRYYNGVSWGRFSQMTDWAAYSYTRLERPYRIHNTYQYPSWLERYEGSHPPQILALWEDIQSGRLDPVIRLRPTDDAERLLASFTYRAGRSALKLGGMLFSAGQRFGIGLFRLLPRSLRESIKTRLGQG